MDTTTDTAEAISHPTTDSEASPSSRSLPLHRPFHGRMVAGVAAGVADYLGIDVTIVRIILAVLTIMGGAGLPIYLAGWLLIPDEGTDQSLASELIQSLSARSR
jgi:phage shock protein C